MANGKIFSAVILSCTLFAAWGIQGLGSPFLDEEHTLKLGSATSHMASVDGSGNVRTQVRKQDAQSGMGDERTASLDYKGEVSVNDDEDMVLRENLKQSQLADDLDDTHVAGVPAQIMEATGTGASELNHRFDTSNTAVGGGHMSATSTQESLRSLTAVGSDRMIATSMQESLPSGIIRMQTAASSSAQQEVSAELESVAGALSQWSLPALMLGGLIVMLLLAVWLWHDQRRLPQPQAPNEAQKEKPASETAAGKDGVNPTTLKSAAKKEGYFSSFFKKAAGSSTNVTDSYSAARTERKAVAEGADDVGDGAKGDDSGDDTDDDEGDAMAAPTSRRTKYTERRTRGAKKTVTIDDTQQDAPRQADSRSGEYDRTASPRQMRRLTKGNKQKSQMMRSLIWMHLRERARGSVIVTSDDSKTPCCFHLSVSR